MPPLLLAESLTKNYGRHRALDGLTLSISPGEVVGLLGPNGSGKTTALRLLLGFLRPTSGRASIGGFDSWKQSVEARKLMTYLPGELRLYESMTGRQLVKFLGQLRNDEPGDAVDALAKRLDIDPDTALTRMSSGMKRKIALLAVLLPKVPLVILDEPTNTLDPTMRDEFLEQIRRAKSDGKAILFSSHVLAEVEAVCDRVLILRKGVLVHEQKLDVAHDARRVTVRWNDSTSTRLDPNGKPIAVENGVSVFEFDGPLGQLTAWLNSQSLEELKVEPIGLSRAYRRFHRGESKDPG